MINARALVAALAMQPLLIGAAFAADCNPELKPTDGYKELSEKLKCLATEIATLKKRLPGDGNTPSTAQAKPPSDRGVLTQLPNGCLNAHPGDSGFITLKLKYSSSAPPKLCWADGVQFMTFADFRDNQVDVKFLGIDTLPNAGHNKWWKFTKHEDAIFEWRSAMLADQGDGVQHMKLELKLSPKSK